MRKVNLTQQNNLNKQKNCWELIWKSWRWKSYQLKWSSHLYDKISNTDKTIVKTAVLNLGDTQNKTQRKLKIYLPDFNVQIVDVSRKSRRCTYLQIISNYTLRFVACGQLDDTQFGFFLAVFFFCLIMMNVTKVHKKFLINVFIGGIILADWMFWTITLLLLTSIWWCYWWHGILISVSISIDVVFLPLGRYRFLLIVQSV